MSETGTFNSGKNGQITASLEVAPPPSTLDGPGNPRLVLACVSYTNIALSDDTNGVTADVTGSPVGDVRRAPECAGFDDDRRPAAGGSPTIASATILARAAPVEGLGGPARLSATPTLFRPSVATPEPRGRTRPGWSAHPNCRSAARVPTEPAMLGPPRTTARSRRAVPRQAAVERCPCVSFGSRSAHRT